MHQPRVMKCYYVDTEKILLLAFSGDLPLQENIPHQRGDLSEVVLCDFPFSIGEKIGGRIRPEPSAL